MKTLLYTGLFTGLIFLLFINGVFRHDVSEKEYLNLAKEPEFDCVVRVFNGRESIGSGVLISDRYVLSAAHIVIGSDVRETFMLTQSGDTAIIYETFNEHVIEASGIRIVLNGKKQRLKRIVVYPDYLADLSAGVGDIVLFELEESCSSIIPAVLNFQTDELHAEVTGCGFGASGNAEKPETVKLRNRKIAGQNVIDSLGGSLVNGQDSKLFCDFDHPTNVQCNRMGTAVPRPLEYICSGGDSGGGLFRYKNGKLELVGICSGASIELDRLLSTGYYGQTMSWTRVSAFGDWIKANMQ